MKGAPMRIGTHRNQRAIADLGDRRRSQIAKGYDAAHDDGHTDGSIARAAIAYATGDIAFYPWSDAADVSQKMSQQSDRDRLLVAASLLVAEIERLDRAAAVT